MIIIFISHTIKKKSKYFYNNNKRNHGLETLFNLDIIVEIVILILQIFKVI